MKDILHNKRVMIPAGAILLIGILFIILAIINGGKEDYAALVAPAALEDQIEVPDNIDERILDSEIFLPVGKLITTRMRVEYQDGDLRLVVPRLELDTPVGDRVTRAALDQKPGLYKYAQLPNIYNTNTSIAGHRDLPQYDFYYLDTITDGDYIYLVYMDKVFKYIYRETYEVDRTDWDPVRVYYDTRVTLTTCTPLGTSLRRMVVIGELMEYDDYTDAYIFE